VKLEVLKALQASKEVAKTGGLFFILILWMTWLFLSRQKWLM